MGDRLDIIIPPEQTIGGISKQRKLVDTILALPLQKIKLSISFILFFLMCQKEHQWHFL